MNLNQLKLLYLVAKRGSPNVAAKELSITQPAVTKGIQRLEEHYDIKFINYFGRRNALTDVGKALYGIAEKFSNWNVRLTKLSVSFSNVKWDTSRSIQPKVLGHITSLP